MIKKIQNLLAVTVIPSDEFIKKNLKEILIIFNFMDQKKMKELKK